MHKKLIIWDFDGVIADSEHLWVQNWVRALKDIKNISLSPQEQKYFLEGKADKTKVKLFQEHNPELSFDDDFWTYLRSNEAVLIENELTITAGVEELFADTRFEHCIATGATLAKNNKKLHKLDLEKYFPQSHIFTAYDVENGKPAPDIFLYAACQMGYSTADSIVIEDSLAGINAAVAAGIKVIAYIGATGNNRASYADECRAAHADYITNSMSEVKQILADFLHSC